MVYVDDMQAAVGRMRLCHMVADSVAELLSMADAIGVRRHWFQALSHPHFDIARSKRRLAIARGAIEVDRRGIVAAMQRHREKFRSDPAELEAIGQAAREARFPIASLFWDHGGAMYSAIDKAIEILQRAGREVERAEFPPAPLPGLYRIDGGPELTEAQVFHAAWKAHRRAGGGIWSTWSPTSGAGAVRS